MKKVFITLTGLLLATSGVFASDMKQYTYTPEFINHLRPCVKYVEEYDTSIATEDENTPYLKVKSTEEILGYINSKCYTKSTVYSYDLEKDILTIKCGLTKKQLADITSKMSRINAENSKEVKKALQDELMVLIGNKRVCRVKNYLKDGN